MDVKTAGLLFAASMYCFGVVSGYSVGHGQQPTKEPVVVQTKGPAMYEYWCQITKVVDADTFDGSIDLGFNTRHNDRFRVHHIDAYEKATKKGKEAIVLAKKLLEGKSLKVTTAKPDKYGRWLCDITLEDGRNYAQVMIDEGFAVAYEGKKKTLPQKDAK